MNEAFLRGFVETINKEAEKASASVADPRLVRENVPGKRIPGVVKKILGMKPKVTTGLGAKGFSIGEALGSK